MNAHLLETKNTGIVEDLSTVFLLHYHPLVREWLGRLIDLQTDLGVCGRAEKADDALAEVAELQPDVTIVDAMLLNEASPGLIGDLTRVAPFMKVIVFSVYDDWQEAAQAIHGGACGYVNCSAHIIRAIRRVLAGNLFLFDSF